MSRAGEEAVKPCPFCGNQPDFDEAHTISDRRYYAMNLKCCVEMTSHIPYGKYREMTESAITTELRGDLIKQWNYRYNEEAGE